MRYKYYSLLFAAIISQVIAAPLPIAQISSIDPVGSIGDVAIIVPTPNPNQPPEQPPTPPNTPSGLTPPGQTQNPPTQNPTPQDQPKDEIPQSPGEPSQKGETNNQPNPATPEGNY